MNATPAVAVTAAGLAPAPSSRLRLWVAGYLLIGAALAVLSLLVGTSSLRTSVAWLLHPQSLSDTVLWEIRLPRALGAWCAGALLGLGGALAQGVFRNALAEPYLLGSASGAALGVTVSLLIADSSLTGVAFLGQLGLTGAAFLGACLGITLTLALSRGALRTQSLLLSGVVVGFLLNAVTSLLLMRSPDTWRAMQSFLMGSTALVGWHSTALLGAALLVCVIPALLLARGLDALSLGEDTAQSLGVPVARLRLILLGILSLATAASVSQLGTVGFVGLVAPHLVRESLPVNQRQLVLAAGLCGGALLEAADLLSRALLRPAELPVGIVTACLGGAYLVVLLWRRSRDE